MGMESFVVLILAALAVTPALLRCLRGRSGASSAVAVFVGVGILFVVGLRWIQLNGRSNLPAPIATSPKQVLREGYVSSKSCRQCHPGAYDSWHASFHRTMTQLPSEETVLGDFENVSAQVDGEIFRMTRRGGEFWVEMPAFDDRGELVPGGERIERRIALLTGSHHMQVYWFTAGKSTRLDQFPLVWFMEEQRWIPRNSSFLVPPHQGMSSEPGRWNKGCIRCHATDGNPSLFNDAEMYTTVAEFGIACEACHGPSEAHVAINQNPLHRYRNHADGPGDETIVHPVRLKQPLDSQVCGQCHSVNVESSPQIRSEFHLEGFSYKPGADLTAERDVFVLSDKKMMDSYGGAGSEFIRNFFWRDGMVRVAGREYNGLLESPCYQRGEGHRRMTCFSCHEMHGGRGGDRSSSEWADDQLKPGMRGNQACLQCHDDYSLNISAHTHHAVESSGSRCYNCHMSHTTYGLLKSIRSHQIDVPNVATDLATGRPNACNLCHLDRTLAWTSGHLKEWYGIDAPQLSEEERTVAASILWLLKGDAGQRALMAGGLGWDPAVAVSDDGWREVYLAQLLADPYDAVRFMAFRSLRLIPGFEDLDYDYVGDEGERVNAALRVRAQWKQSQLQSGGGARSELLFSRPGELDAARFDALLRQRDDTPIVLSE